MDKVLALRECTLQLGDKTVTRKKKTEERPHEGPLGCQGWWYPRVLRVLRPLMWAVTMGRWRLTGRGGPGRGKHRKAQEQETRELGSPCKWVSSLWNPKVIWVVRLGLRPWWKERIQINLRMTFLHRGGCALLHSKGSGRKSRRASWEPCLENMNTSPYLDGHWKTLGGFRSAEVWRSQIQTVHLQLLSPELKGDLGNCGQQLEM